jgi:putative ABC transport system permease protein
VYRLDPGNVFMHPVVGRLRDGATPTQARDELASIMRSLPADPRGAGIETVARIVPLQDLVTGRVEKSLLIFSAAVGFVLLIACANVANLLLIRAAGRRHEMAVRAALGASRGRLIRQLLTESVLVASIGGALGIGVAMLGVRALLAAAPEGRIPRVGDIHLDGCVLLFTLGVSLLTGVAFGLVPAFNGARRSPRESLSSGSRTIVGTHARLRGSLVVAEIALALVLMTGAGLMIKSFLRMRAVDTGFAADRVVTMSATLPRTTYGDAARMRAFHTATLERLAATPGVAAAGAVAWRPLGGIGIMGTFSAEPPFERPKGFMVDKPTISPGYFQAMGIPLLRGRDFTNRDDVGAAGVVIVSQSVANRIWPNADPIGRRLTMSDDPKTGDWLTVVGVVKDVVQDAGFRPAATMYLPYRQTTSLWFIEQMTYVVRASVDPQPVMRAMRGVIRDVDPTVAPQGIGRMDEFVAAATAEPLFQTRLLTIFSLLALLLAAIGTYGVLAYDVSERRHEIGLRMALGATPGGVLWLVMRRTLLLAGPGALLGLAGAAAVTGVLRKSLFDVTPTDPSILAAVAVAVVLVAVAAGLVPARRATRVEPLSILPHE